MPTPGLELKQERVLAALIETANITKACKAAGVTRKTFYNWQDADPAFRLRLQSIRERMITEALDGLAMRTRAALEAIDAALEDENAGTRLRAAQAVLDHLMKLKDMVDVEARLKRLEEMAAQSGKEMKR